jgi:para-aminobenzoate synthetase component 1
VLQAIEDLEPVPRGVYCGAVGWIDDDTGALELNVAIRTFQILDGRTHLGVGGGITADSEPGAEWRETELKAARLLAVATGAGWPRTGRKRGAAGVSPAPGGAGVSPGGKLVVPA